MWEQNVELEDTSFIGHQVYHSLYSIIKEEQKRKQPLMLFHVKCGPMSSCGHIWTLGHQQVALLRRTVEHLGCGDLLEEVSDWGEALRLYSLVTFHMHFPFPEWGDLNENGSHQSIH